MPVLPNYQPHHYHQPHKRIESGTTFSICFGVFAALVVIACFIWGIAIPEYRAYRKRKSTEPQWTGSTVLTRRRRSRLRKSWPSHPAVRPLLSKPSAVQVLTTYNPRTESPFPEGIALPMVTFGPQQTSRAQSTPLLSASASSNGLFTPIKRSNVENDESKNRYHTVPRASDAKHFPDKSFDYADAKEFILAVPEPLALKPREAGRPPAVARHLERYGTSHTTSPANSDKLLHPNKLFRVVQRAEICNSFCSSTSMRVDHRQSDAAKALASKDNVDIDDEAIEEETNKICFTLDSDHESDKRNQLVPMTHALHDSQDKDLATVHRLRSYQSLTGGQPAMVARTGTLTRPKTPVEELRKLYGQDQRSVTLPSMCLPHAGTVSTLLTNTEFGSDYDSISTTATSPAFPPSNMSLLPTPLHLKKSFEPGSTRSHITSQHGIIGSTMSGEQSFEKVQPTTLVGSRPGHSKNTRGFYHTGRRLTKPPPLDIKHTSKALPSDDRHSRRSFTEFSHAVFGPLIKQNGMRSRARASSLYSRDTYGISMVNTPVTPDFPTPATDAFTDHSASGNPFKSQESVKARINEWTQRIEGNAGHSLPPIRHVSPFLKDSQRPDEIISDTIDAKPMIDSGEGPR